MTRLPAVFRNQSQYSQSLYVLRPSNLSSFWSAIRILLWDQVKEFPISIPFQKAIEPLQEAIPLAGIVAGDVFEVGTQEDQAAGAVLAFGGTEAGLGAADLLLQIVLLAALGILQLPFLCLEFLLEGFFPGEQLFEFFLWFHHWR